MGFLPNGDLVLISLDDKICLYYYKDRPATDVNYWQYSQVYDIEIPDSLNELGIQFYVYQTKLLIFNGIIMVQWNLSEMTFDMKYNLINNDYISHVVINKDQTLLALDINGEIDVFLMDTGACISKYSRYYFYNFFLFLFILYYGFV